MNEEPPLDPDPLVRLRRGDAGALEALIERWQRPLFSFAWKFLGSRADAEDLVIETFVKLHDHRAGLGPETNLPAWLFTTLANLCRNRHRWRRRHPEERLEEQAGNGATPACPADPPDAALQQDEVGRLVRAAIDGLPADQKTALLLHHFARLSHREVAAAVGCSERGVETRLYRARARLRRKLAPLLGELLPDG